MKEGKKVWLVAGEGRRQEGEEWLIHLHVSTIVILHSCYLGCSGLLHRVWISGGNNACGLNCCC